MSKTIDKRYAEQAKPGKSNRIGNDTSTYALP